jgi:hypothetical protein
MPPHGFEPLSAKPAQIRLLPHSNIVGRFTSINRHWQVTVESAPTVRNLSFHGIRCMVRPRPSSPAGKPAAR